MNLFSLRNNITNEIVDSSKGITCSALPSVHAFELPEAEGDV